MQTSYFDLLTQAKHRVNNIEWHTQDDAQFAILRLSRRVRSQGDIAFISGLLIGGNPDRDTGPCSGISYIF